VTQFPFAHDPTIGSPLASNEQRLARHFGDEKDLLPLWIAEPYLPLAPEIVDAVRRRAAEGWYGYEMRSGEIAELFWEWMGLRHGWSAGSASTLVSPSVGSSIGGLIDGLSEPGQGIILQPPVFTDFKPLIRRADREPVTNPLVLSEGRYRMDIDGLEAAASSPKNSLMILCNPHNPVGRVWSPEELRAVADICARHDVFVVADEIHADLMLGSSQFTPFASVAASAGTRWAALHGPIKTFGLAGVCDTLIVTDDAAAHEAFAALSSRLHLTRTNVFGVAAMEAAYRSAGPWLDEMLVGVGANLDRLEAELPAQIGLIRPEGTYLAWIDLRSLGLDVPELSAWLTDEARLALSPGHWFGREGAGFARMTVATNPAVLSEAASRLSAALGR